MSMFDITIENSTLASQAWKYGKTYWASFELYPESKGHHFYCFRGAAFNEKDYWSETAVMVKTFRHIDATENDWVTYKHKCDVARKISAQFNKLLEESQCNTKVNFVKPIDAVMDNISDIMPLTRFFMRFNKRFSQDEAVLFEDLLDGEFTTFVTSEGQTTSEGSHFLDAFSHFTYQASGQVFVICNLKGVEDEGDFKLTNPTIHSNDGCYGDTDSSVIGIRDFFKNHICTSLCKDFIKPNSSDIAVLPSAPIAPSEGNTISKEIEATSGPSFDSKPCSLPEYMTVDPNGPPPYDT